MAEKEATVFIVDVGRSMGVKNHGRKQSDLDWALTYVFDRITSTMALDRKTTFQGVIGLRTKKTANELGEDDDAYEHISVLQELSTIKLSDLKRLKDELVPSPTDDGDAISAIIVAIQMISKQCKKLKYKRKIVLVTNGTGEVDTDNKDEIERKLSEDGIELTVLGPDFDDEDYGVVEKGKPKRKSENEKVFSAMTESTDGIFGTLAQAVNEMSNPRLKQTKPIPSFRDGLSLGDRSTYDDALTIDVERYPKTMIRRPPTASSFVPKSEQPNPANGEGQPDTPMPDAEASKGPLALVRNSRAYQVKDETAEGGKREVPTEDLAKGYEYGRTAVHISDSDMNIIKMDTSASLEIVGFVPADKYSQYMGLSRTNLIIGQRTNPKAILALSSLIHALRELESLGIGRLVTKPGNNPLLVLLAPIIEEDYEALVDVELPFAEDLRSYRFPPLDKVLTISGKEIKEHRNIPDEALKSAMSDFVDSMDLSNFGTDDEGNPTDYMQISESFSPLLHRVDQSIRHRAANQSEPVPPPAEVLLQYSKPPDELMRKAKAQLDKLVSQSNVKPVPPKVTARRNRETTKPVSGLDVAALLSTTRASAGPVVSTENPIPSFIQFLEETTDPNGIQTAAAQFGELIENQIKDSVGDANYERAIEEMKVLRTEMSEFEEPGIWNKWIGQLREKLRKDDLRGYRLDLWDMVRKEKLGLLDDPHNHVSTEDKDGFFKLS